MIDLSEILPSRIDERLRHVGKSKRAVSLNIGAHERYVGELFDHERFSEPSASRLLAIADELRTTPAYLMGKSDDPEADYPEERLTVDERSVLEQMALLGVAERKAVETLVAALAGAARSGTTLHDKRDDYRAS